MFYHNLLILYRNVKRFKSTFLINLIGLSTGLTCTLLIYLWVMDEWRVDKFLENDERIFQVMQNTQGMNGVETMEATPGLLAKALKDEMPEVNYSIAVVPPTFNISQGIISFGNTHIKASGQYVSKDFFHVFSYKLIHGDKKNVLSDKNGIVISKKLALKLFKTVEKAIGKSIEWNAQEITGLSFVSGVFESPPSNATNQFDLLINFDRFEEINPSAGWGNNSPRTYVLLKDDVSLEELNHKIKGLIKEKDPNSNATLFLQRYSDRYLHGYYENGKPAGGRIEYVNLFTIIGIFILVIACINFMNLSTAKSFQKMKEVGIKKAFGAKQSTLILQYLTESIVMAFLSLGLAVLLVDLLLSTFSTITGKNLHLSMDVGLILSALGITLFTGLLSGSYPALYLSGVRAAHVLKGKIPTFLGEDWTRKGLVIFQFAISVILIISVVVVYKQMEFVQTKNLGYERDHVIYFDTPAMSSAFMSEIKNIPGVLDAGGGRLKAGGLLGGTNDVHWEGKSPDDQTFLTKLWVCYGLVETLSMETIEGRTFSENFGTYDQIILNEEAIRIIGLKDPVGKKITIGGEERRIVGIIKNFHFESLYEKVKPCALLLAPLEHAPNVSVKIQAGTVAETLRRLQKLYESHYSAQPFDFKFMNDDYQRLYAGEQRVADLSKYFAGLAIIISCLGLFGLAAFTAERRFKEIGIRKVLGSSVFGIVTLLSVDFTKIVLLSILIALPIGYVITKQWLDGFAFRISLEWWYFIGAGLIALIISWITVTAQAFKAARVNPVKCLNNE